MKPCKHQRSEQRYQDLCWKVHNHAQSFVLCSYTMQELRNQNISIGEFQSGQSKHLLCFVHGQGQKIEQNLKQRNLSGFVII